MNVVLSPIISEFETEELADSYDRWFRAKVERAVSLADDPNTPRYTSDEVARRMHKLIEQAQTIHAARHLA